MNRRGTHAEGSGVSFFFFSASVLFFLPFFCAFRFFRGPPKATTPTNNALKLPVFPASGSGFWVNKAFGGACGWVSTARLSDQQKQQRCGLPLPTHITAKNLVLENNPVSAGIQRKVAGATYQLLAPDSFVFVVAASVFSCVCANPPPLFPSSLQDITRVSPPFGEQQSCRALHVTPARANSPPSRPVTAQASSLKSQRRLRIGARKEAGLLRSTRACAAQAGP